MCALPLGAAAKPVGTFGFVAAGDGDQIDPAIDGQYVVFAGPGPAGDGLDVFLYDIQNGTSQTIAGGAGAQDAPGVSLSTAIYRGELSAGTHGIFIESWPTNQVLRAPPAGGDGAVANPVVHAAVAAWEVAGANGLDVVVSRYRAGAAYVLRSPGDGEPTGDQRAPSVYDGLVAYVDDARGGSVWLHDSGRGRSDWTQVAPGPATGVSLGFDGTRYVVAVSRDAGATGEDIEIYDRDGNVLATLPAGGAQRNPHVSGDWVAFDDHSGTHSQVVVWRWRTPAGGENLVFVPHPTATDQRLNDASLVLADELRVVFEDAASATSGRDIALYRLPVNPLVDDGTPNGWPPDAAPAPSPARCDDPDAIVLAALELTRGQGQPDAEFVAFEVAPPDDAETLGVLVCVHAERVSSAWVLLGGHAVARPDDFDGHDADFSVRSRVRKGHRKLGAILAGKPGARLQVRVLADPTRPPCEDERDDDDGEDEDDDEDRDRKDGRDAEEDDDEDRDRKDGRDAEEDDDGGRREREHRRRHHCRPPPDDREPAAPADPPADGPVTSADPVDAGRGGCGNAGSLPSLAVLGLFLARRRTRR